MSTDLLAERDALAARVAQLESELAALRKPAPRKRASSQATEACQYCNDTKNPKLTFLGLPLCAGTAQGGDGKCGSRIRSMAKNGRAHEAYAYDGRYGVRPEGGEWVARLDGQIITSGVDRGAVRRFASDHKRTERLAA